MIVRSPDPTHALACSAAAAALLLGLCATESLAQSHSLRFFGGGVNAPDADRVKIRIDDPALPDDPGPAVDVGDDDLTIEFWMKASALENDAQAVTCGNNYDWIYGNIVLDRDRFSQPRAYGIAIAGGLVVFGLVTDYGARTLCSRTDVLDERWHHVAVERRRSDGMSWLYVDGALEDQGLGPEGDLSYPDNGEPGPYCGGPCVNSDPFIVLGAEKHDAGAAYPSYSGHLDELRFSTTLRYGGAAFATPTEAFAPDSETAGLYHFDEGTGTTAADTSGASSPPANGMLQLGGTPTGPIWSSETPVGEVATPIPVMPGAVRIFLAIALIASATATLRFIDLVRRRVSSVDGTSRVESADLTRSRLPERASLVLPSLSHYLSRLARRPTQRLVAHSPTRPLLPFFSAVTLDS